MSNKNIEISYTLDDFSGDYDAIIPVHRNLHKYRRLINSDLYYGGGHLQCGEIVLYPEEDKPYKRWCCLLYTSPSPRDRQKSRMPSSA